MDPFALALLQPFSVVVNQKYRNMKVSGAGIIFYAVFFSFPRLIDPLAQVLKPIFKLLNPIYVVDDRAQVRTQILTHVTSTRAFEAPLLVFSEVRRVRSRIRGGGVDDHSLTDCALQNSQGGLTNGRVGLLVFHKVRSWLLRCETVFISPSFHFIPLRQFIFSLGQPIVPVALRYSQPLVPINMDTLTSSATTNLLWFLFCPVQYDVAGVVMLC